MIKEKNSGNDVKAGRVEIKTYEASGGVPIEVSCRTFVPGENRSPKNKASGEAYVVFPGVGFDAGGQTAEDFGESFARSSGETTYVITTKIVTQIENSTYEEARACVTFLKEKGLTTLTIAGNSMGGHKAVDVVCILQKEDVVVEGLALLSSVGIRETTPMALAQEFFMNDPLATARDLVGPESKNKKKQHKTKITSGIRAAFLNAEVATGIATYLMEITKNPKTNPTVVSRIIHGLSRVVAELESASRLNPRLKEIQCPVVLISGDQDLVSGLKEIVAHEKNLKARGNYLQKKIFPKSPAVKVFTLQEMGGHGNSILRAQEVADIAVRSLRQMQKIGG